MAKAIALAKQAVANGDEPFGAVLVKDGQAVYSNHNQIYTNHDPTFHAEAGLIRRFCAETGITDLSDYTLYSNCEPCFMCAGALAWAKLGRLVYGASDVDLCQILGVTGSQCCQIVFESMNCPIQVEGGVLREQALADLQNYFAGHTKG